MNHSLAILLLVLLADPAVAQSVRLGSGMSWPPVSGATITAPGVNGAVRLVNSASDLTIGPATVIGAYRLLESGEGTKLSRARIVGLKGRDLQRDGIRLRKATEIEVSEFDLQMRAEPQTGKNLPEGIAIGAGSNITIRDGILSGFRMVEEIDLKTKKHQYVNGDGIATEAAVDGLTITDVTSRDNSDAGFDLKGRHIRLDRLTAERNSRNFRFWHEVDAGTLTSIDGGTAVWVGKGASVTVAKLIARSSKPAQVLALEGQTDVTIRSCDLSGMAPGSVLTKVNASGNKVVLGPGCKLP